MKKKIITCIAAACMAAVMAFPPADALAASLLKRGSSGGEVQTIQMTLKKLGYFTYPKATGYYGSITERAVKQFQEDHNINPDGIIGRKTKRALFTGEYGQEEEEAIILMATVTDSSKIGDLDWFSEVQYIFARGDVARITDIDTGRDFLLKRTYGTNHADVEPLTRNDAETIKDIWGGWKWTRRAVLVEIDGCLLAASLSAMPHAGVDNAPAEQYVSRRSGGYGWGQNLDAVKDNGVSGVMDLHFKNSRNHNTNLMKKAHQDMVKKAALYIEENY